MSTYLPILIGVLLFIGFAVFKKKKATRPTKSATPWRFLNSVGSAAAADEGMASTAQAGSSCYR